MTAIAATQRQYKDPAIIGLIAAAHYSSHVMQIALPPLFPLLYREFGVSYAELGLVATLFYSASGFSQPVAGILVDRYGAHRVLLCGMVVLSLAMLLMGLVSAFWMLLPLAAMAGFGNSVFHPADLSILSHRVTPRRLGRAFAGHGLSGALGFVSTPVVVTAIAAYAGWRAAPVACGIFGLVVTALLFFNRAALVYDRKKEPVRPAGSALPQRTGRFGVYGSPIIVMAFAYFALTAFAGNGVQTFGIATWTTGYGLTLSLATFALTAFLAGNVVGIVIGGVLADRTHEHHRVAMAGIAATAAAVFYVSVFAQSPTDILIAMAVTGLAYGATGPSRDILIRRSASGTGLGKVFGFVYSGFDLGSSVAPLVYGALLDHHAPRTVFLVVAVFFALSIPTVMQVRRGLTSGAPAGTAAD